MFLAAAVLRQKVLWLVYPVCAALAALAAAADLSAMLTPGAAGLVLPLGLPSTGLNLRLDALSSFFGMIVNLGVLTVSIYGLGLDRQHDFSPRIEPFVPLFAAAMNMVLVAGDAFIFLFSWELMSLSSWALVCAKHLDADNRKAGFVYLVMAAIGTAALLFAFGGLAGTAGGYTFETMRMATLSPVASALVLAAVLVGAGSKAGIVPLHAWLPLAHPAAPSHVSALM
ncbi:MAG: hydrogenase 4 subunit B, partial [Alphaproteobacteria bacterium]|nr:hydrogenase 4 subunit B [Alphaproteobacteria bacterium]